MFTLLFHLHFAQRQKLIDERKTKVLLGIYKHLGPNSNVMNFFFHTFSLWIPLIHECIGHWSNVLLSWPTLHNRMNSFPKEHSWLGAVYAYATLIKIFWIIPKGQLISKCLLGVFLSTKTPTKRISALASKKMLNQKLYYIKYVK